jgi:L-rhamnonate dehydratase
VRIAAVRTRCLRWSRPPTLLRRNLATPTHDLNPGEADTETAGPDPWGPVALVLVEVTTDDGITGFGTAGGFTGVSAAIVSQHLAPLVHGADPFDLERLWSRMYRATLRFGRGGATMAAISAVDIACWDIVGKALGQPLYRLLGGQTKDRIPAYASRLYALEDLDQLAAEARGYVSQGFRALKQRFGYGPADGPEGMRRNLELVRTVREAVGNDITLAADAYMAWDVPYTLAIGPRLAEFDLAWLEEPLPPHDLGGYVRLRRELPLRLAAGEHLYGRHSFRQWLEAGALDVLQPDANRVGGISELRKVCVLAASWDLPVLPHSNEAHNLHVIMSQVNCPMVEYFPDVEPDTGNELFWKVFRGEPRAHAGCVIPSDRPGLGIEPDPDVVAALEVRSVG